MAVDGQLRAPASLSLQGKKLRSCVLATNNMHVRTKGKTAPVFQPTQTPASVHKTPSFSVKKERKNKNKAKKNIQTLENRQRNGNTFKTNGRECIFYIHLYGR